MRAKYFTLACYMRYYYMLSFIVLVVVKNITRLILTQCTRASRRSKRLQRSTEIEPKEPHPETQLPGMSEAETVHQGAADLETLPPGLPGLKRSIRVL